MDSRLLVVIFFTMVIHWFNTVNYSVRLAGVRTQRLALAFSLWNVLWLISSTANTIQAPLMGKIVDENIHKLPNLDYNQLATMPLYHQTLEILNSEFRLVLLAALVGTILGSMSIPSFVRIFTKGILAFEQAGSIPRLVKMLFSPVKIKGLAKDISLPRAKVIGEVGKKGIPKRLIVLNTLTTGIFTTGVLSAMFAGAINPDLRATAVTLSSIVNGAAQILSATLVDPKVASIVDQALRGIRSEDDVKNLTMYLAFSRIAGALLAQVFFVPAAWIIVYVARII